MNLGMEPENRTQRGIQCHTGNGYFRRFLSARRAPTNCPNGPGYSASASLRIVPWVITRLGTLDSRP
jgi:hypothetical protein